MAKFFNTAGLCFPGKHYMVDPLTRLREVEDLIEKELYFTIHAPRQTGKTTLLYALAKKLNAAGKKIALVVSFEQAGYASITVDKANEVLISRIYDGAAEQLPKKYWPENPGDREYLNVKQYLRDWCENQQKPVVLLIDEIDALLDDVLISVLRQLRDGYQSRPKFFPASIALVGLRDVKDYKAQVREGRPSLGTASPFNVKSDALFLTNFSKEEIVELLDQHTQETGQVFPAEVKEEIYRLTRGQPWLTNALANLIVSKILKEDYTKKITLEIVIEAKNLLILRQDTHLDSLADKLREDRVKRIVNAIINGENLEFDILNEDVKYVRDLGIVSQVPPLEFANPIYVEIIPRVMAFTIQESIPGEIQTPWFVKEGNKEELDMNKVLKAFQEFYREDAEHWLNRFAFKESAHHLLLMAFLQRLVNAGGEIEREMAVGSGRVDLLVKFYRQRTALELKINRGERSVQKGKEQLSRYLDRLGMMAGYLVLFDPSQKDWDEKLYFQEIIFTGKKITLVGL